MQSRSPLPSSFELIIDELFSNDERPAGAPGSHRFSFNSIEAAWSLAANLRDGGAEPSPRSYSFEDSENKDLERLLDPNRILIELGLDADLSEEDIAALRREFAFRNHPDRVAPELRELATRRMMIANDLMDRYVARLHKAVR